MSNFRKLLKRIRSNEPTLESINLIGYRICDIEVELLARALKNNTKVKELEKNKTLIFLHLGHNPIGDEGVQFLAEALEKNTTLENLNLDEGKIGDEGAEALAKSLTINTTLKILDLSHNKIGATGLQALEIAYNGTNLYLQG